jgi:hypothetical protein
MDLATYVIYVIHLMGPCHAVLEVPFAKWAHLATPGGARAQTVKANRGQVGNRTFPAFVPCGAAESRPSLAAVSHPCSSPA